MKLKSAWTKNNIRDIKHTIERYIAIIIIIILGVGFLCGLKITKSAMVKTLDNYVAKHNMYDFRLVSTLGLTKEDVEYFDSHDDATAEGAVSIDFMADIDEKELVLKAHSITYKVNQLNVISGRLPEANNECVADSLHFSESDIGKTIVVSSLNDDDTIETLACKEYTIVGIANSVNYINIDRGTTKIAGGSVNAFIYIPENGFSNDYYTEIYIKLANDKKVYSDEYNNLISSTEDSFAKELENRADLRHRDIVKEATEEFSKAQKEYQDAYDKYLSEKSDSEAELNDAWDKLENARIEIEKNEKELKDSEKQIAKAEKEYNESFDKYKKSLSEYETQKADTLATLDAKQSEIDNNRKSISSAMVQIEKSGVLEQYYRLTETIHSLENSLSQISSTGSDEYIAVETQLEQAKLALSEIEATGVIEQYTTLQSSLGQVDEAQKDLDMAKEAAKSKFEATEAELAAARTQLDSAKKELDNGSRKIRDGWSSLKEGRDEYNKNLKDYEEAKKKAENSFAEAEEKLSKSKEEIDNAKKEIQDIPEPKTYVFDRSYNTGYASFENDSSIVDGIAKVLPIFFFLVAALICSTTMTRMVDEQRTQIGTLKALGYSNRAITWKYVFYSGSASVLGCFLGYLLGTKYFPMAIWAAYNMIYDFAPIVYVFDIWLALISLAASLLCSVGATYLSCRNELTQMPAELIRPKAPKPGRRVILERIPFIWNKFGFLHKVSIRNILRYKKRFLMTVLGVAGCTSLIVAALGIKDSISNIVNDQFDTITKYDYEIYFSEAQSQKNIQEFKEKYSDLLSECVFVSTDTVEIVNDNGGIKKCNLIATDDPNITNIIGLYLNGKRVTYPEFGKVAINKKLADNADFSVGDTITVKINDAEEVELEIGGIFENYISNYMYMTGETYEAFFGTECQYKNAYAKAGREDLYAISASLSENDNVASVSVLNDMRITVDNMMKSLNYVIWLVIACAGALGFVVIYNLNNINITERTREIATIKVLGFYFYETYSYVFRENIVLTAIGAFLGLGLGKLLHGFVMGQIDIEMVAFKEQIFTVSYIIAIIFTFVLTIMVNLMLRRKIDNINMAESLKTVE